MLTWVRPLVVVVVVVEVAVGAEDIIEESIELAVDIWDDMAELSIMADELVAELSAADDEDIAEDSMADEEDWARAPVMSTAVNAVPPRSRRIILISRFCVARGAGCRSENSVRRRSFRRKIVLVSQGVP